MKTILASFMLVLFMQVGVFSQTLLDEYDGIGAHSESALLDYIVSYTQDNPASKIVFVIYVGNGEERVGSVKPYIKTVQYYLSDLRGLDPKIIDFRVVKGKTLFLRRIWAISKNDPDLEFTDFEFDFSNLKSQMLYARTCLNCDGYPADPDTHRIDWELLSKILKDNDSYSLRIEITGNKAYGDDGKEISEKAWFAEVRSLLIKETGIDNKRIKLVKFKAKKGETATIAKFYIIPPK
ncbi:MAG: hypothetical protein KDB79_07315 [Acidobacteria bacterium]|nr:hypothetical protein [Acidobacteriota bacterium]